MKKLIILMLLGTLFSCTKQLVVQPLVGSGQDKEKTKLEVIRTLGEKRISENSYVVVIIDHIKSSRIEYPVPKEKSWELPLTSIGITCKTNGEEVGTKEFFLMEVICQGQTEYDLASVVACGINNKFDAETLRIIKQERPILTIQIQCSN